MDNILDLLGPAAIFVFIIGGIFLWMLFSFVPVRLWIEAWAAGVRITLGTLVGMPIIPKGTAAILGTGAIEKRAVVVEDPVTGTDAIAIRKRALFSLGYDHRIVDGADAARFLADLKELLEDFPEDA